MRGGYAKRAKLLRLGMVAMFATIALAAAPRRGQTIAELGNRTGRRGPDLRRALKRLKVEGIAREVAPDTYRLTDGFAREYERVLEESGVTYAERQQRRRHEEDRRERDANSAAVSAPRPVRAKTGGARGAKSAGPRRERRREVRRAEWEVRRRMIRAAERPTPNVNLWRERRADLERDLDGES